MATVSPQLIVFIFIGILLGSCTDSGSPAQKAGRDQSAPAEATITTWATRVDSLNGIPGHHFGEPLSSFPGLVPISGKEFGAQSYYYVQQGETGWFGKCTKEHSNDFYTRYTFSGGKFVSFLASGRGEMSQALQQQAEYLYGPGTPTNDGSRWAGSRTEAWMASDTQNSSPVNTLMVWSKAFARQQAQARAAQLRKQSTR